MRAARQGALTVAAALIFAGASLGLAACSSSSGGGSTTPKPKDVGRQVRPNIVLIQADDQTEEQFTHEVMPKTFKYLVGHGTRFSDSVATTAECCPSRTPLIPGQYAHNDGVTSNAVGYPGLVGK